MSVEVSSITKQLDDDSMGQIKTFGSTAAHDNFTRRNKARYDTLNEVYSSFKNSLTPSKSQRRVYKIYPFLCLRQVLGCANVDLSRAILGGNIDKVIRALSRINKKNPDSINTIDKMGCTALSLAVIIQRDDIVELILAESQVDVDKADEKNKMAPLHFCAMIRSESILMQLLTCGATVDIKNKHGVTPLMMACESGACNIVRALLMADSDPQKCDCFGWNSLFFASYSGNVCATQIILEEGVDKLRKDKKQCQAIDWARHMHNDQIVSLLEKHQFYIGFQINQ